MGRTVAHHRFPFNAALAVFYFISLCTFVILTRPRPGQSACRNRSIYCFNPVYTDDIILPFGADASLGLCARYRRHTNLAKASQFECGQFGVAAAVFPGIKIPILKTLTHHML